MLIAVVHYNAFETKEHLNAYGIPEPLTCTLPLFSFLLSKGWEKTLCCNMNDYYVTLPSSERLRVESLELFDEFEEWHTKCSHYIILCATVGQCLSFLKCLPFSCSSSQSSSSTNINHMLVAFRSHTVGRYVSRSAWYGGNRCYGGRLHVAIADVDLK